MDLSADGVSYLKDWAEKEKMDIITAVSDMLNLPYEADSFDCLLAYNVISHTDTKGIVQIIAEIERVLKKDGEFYITLCSKETWEYLTPNNTRVDENTIIKMKEGPEKGIPHFYVDLADILRLFSNFEIIDIKHCDHCYFNGAIQNSKHYWIYGKKVFY